jgi:uncharacterized membrane protein
MKFFWSLQDIPELANLKTEQQQVAFRECYQKYLFSLWQTWMACAVMSLSVTIGMHVFGPIIGGIVGGAIGGLLLSAIITNALRPKLKAYVNHHFQERVI